MRLLRALLVLALLSTAGPAAAAEGPHLLVRITNEGPATELRLVISENERVVHEGPVSLAADRRTEFPFPLAPGGYQVALFRDPEEPVTPLSGSGMVAQGAWNQDCPGPFAVDFVVAPSRTSTEGRGCLVLSYRAAEVLDAARTAGGRGLARVDVPMPGSQDVGNLSGSPFEWRDAEFLDAWGRPTRGHEVTYLSTPSGKVTTGGFVSRASAEVAETLEVLRWRGDEITPHAWSNTLPGFGRDEAPTASSVTIARDLRFDDPRSSVACVLRHGVQGTTLRVGDAVEASAFCRALEGPAWRVGAPVDEMGIRGLPLYQWEETEERVLVSRLLFVDGIPYPVLAQRHELRFGAPLREWGAMLAGYERRGEPIAQQGDVPAAPRVDLAPVDPLRGPATGEVGARLPFTLAAASDAARADPTLRDLQVLLARPDAALVAADLHLVRDDLSRQHLFRWTLAFSSRDGGMAVVECSRPDAPPTLPVGLPARCGPPQGEVAFAEQARLGRGDLRAMSPSFAAAIARWDAFRGDADARVTWAEYRAGPDGSLALGTAPARALGPVTMPREEATDHVVLSLTDGGTLSRVELIQRTASVEGALGLAPGAGLVARDEATPRDLVLPIAAGVGALVLALLAGLLLYSRIQRARVLDDATRAALHAIVAEEPGLHASAILGRLDKRSGVGEYHLGVLVREGLLTCVVTPGFRRYFVTGSLPAPRMRAIAALREGRNEKLMAIIRENPGIELRVLADQAGLSVSQASRSVARLAEAGLVDKVQSGRRLMLHAIEATS